MKRDGLALRLVAVMAACMIPVMAFSLWSLNEARELRVQEAGSNYGSNARLAGQQYLNLVQESLTGLSILVTSEEVVSGDGRECQLRLDRMEDSPTFSAIAVIDTTGQMLCARPRPDMLPSVSDRPWFRQVLETRSLAVSSYQQGRVSGLPSFTVGMPVFDDAGALVRIGAISINLEQFAAGLGGALSDEGMAITLIRPDGDILFRVPGLLQYGGRKPVADEIIAWAFAEGSGTMRDTGVDGVERLIAFEVIGAGPERVLAVVSEPLEKVLAEPNRRFMMTAAVLLAVAVLGFLFALWVAVHNVARPVRSLAVAARRIGRGETAVDIPTDQPIAEMADMAEALARMHAEVRRRQNVLESQVVLLERFAEAENLRTFLEEVLLWAESHVSGMRGLLNVTDPSGKSFVDSIAPRLPLNVTEAIRGQSLRPGVLPSMTCAMTGQELIIPELKADPRLSEIAWVAETLDTRAAACLPVKDRRGRVRAVLVALFRDPHVPDEREQNILDFTVQIIAMAMERDAAARALIQSQKLEAVGRLTGGIAHDFNNVNTVVLGNAEMLARDLSEGSRHQRMAKMILNAAGRAADLTGKLLAFSRRQPLAPVDADVNELLRSMIPLLRQSLGEGVEVETRLDAGAWPAKVDQAQLESAVLNLAINARDAMPRGGRLLIETTNRTMDTVDATPESPPGDYVVISVSDTGVGMSVDVRERVFEPFFTTKETGKGSGLGLPMVQGFALQSGGRITLYSEPGLGTTVRIYLPRGQEGGQGTHRKDEARPSRKHGGLTERQQVHAGDETVLLVEDDPLVRSHVADMLVHLGYRPVPAATLEEAQAAARAHPNAQILLSDVVLSGGINGRDVARAVQAMIPGIRVVFMSGYAEGAVIHNGTLDPGMTFLAKPFTTAELSSALSGVLRGEAREGER